MLVGKEQKIKKKRLETKVKKKSEYFSAQTECMEEMLKI